MKTSASGRTLIKQFEGVKLSAYKDCVGIWTIGVGHTAAAGPPDPVIVRKISAAECDEILARDLAKFEAGVSKALKQAPSQAQFDAMVSLAFNIGIGAFQRSTVVARFNRGDFDGAAAAFLAWNKAGGREIDGLSRRRRAEMKLFNTGNPQAAQAKFGLLDDPVDMPAEVDAPPHDRTMASSKTGWASIATGAGGIGATVTAAQPLLDGAQSAKDAAGQAAGLLGVDGRLAMLAGLAIVILVGAAFIWLDRRRKLYRDGV